jgi:hypothetical protein
VIFSMDLRLEWVRETPHSEPIRFCHRFVASTSNDFSDWWSRSTLYRKLEK